MILPPSIPPGTVPAPRRAAFLLCAALLLPPVAVLITLTAVYSMTPLACGMQSSAPIHASLSAGIALCALLTALAVWQRFSTRARNGAASKQDDTAVFLADCGIGVSAFCTLAVATMWIAPAFLPPCVV